MLFTKRCLNTQLNKRKKNVKCAVNDIPEEEFCASNCDNIICGIISELKVEAIELRKKNTSDPISVKAPEKEKLSRWNLTLGKPSLIPAHKVVVTIPFQGDGWIFDYKPSPSAEVHNGNLTFTVVVPDKKDKNLFMSKIQGQMELIHKHVENAKQQVNCYNNSLPELVRKAVKDRQNLIKQKLKRQDEIKNLLNHSS